MKEKLNQLNESSIEDATELFLQCCTSTRWIERMIASRPFYDSDDLCHKANQNWQDLNENDYLEAFEGHPRIGDVNSLKEKYANTKMLASGEQASVEQASDATVHELYVGNNAYEEKFGFIFIVCATGKSANEMLELLNTRLPNSRSTELVNAAEEQRKIFQLRLEKLL